MYFYDFPIIRNENRLPVYLTSVGLHECQPHTVRKEGYMYPQILYCTKGRGTLLIDGKKYTVGPYNAVYLPPDYPHEYYPEEEIWDIHWIAPSGYAVKEVLEEFGLNKPEIFRLSEMGLLEHFFRRMHEALMGDSIFGNYRASGYLYDFLIEFYRIISASSSKASTNSVIVRAIDYINIHYKENITLKDLCTEAGVSEQHLCRLFQSTVNSRPMEYIAKRRIQAAKELLTHTDKSVEMIAEETGFCSGSYFCKLFKRYEGITATQFRRI